MGSEFSFPALPLIVIVIGFIILFGFFKKLFVKVAVILIIELLLFAFFPNLLVLLAWLVSKVQTFIP